MGKKTTSRSNNLYISPWQMAKLKKNSNKSKKSKNSIKSKKSNKGRNSKKSKKVKKSKKSKMTGGGWGMRRATTEYMTGGGWQGNEDNNNDASSNKRSDALKFFQLYF